ncbi:TPA: sodium/solute symporter [Aeromonas veronii]|nr:sodium/solute symporter [Aeromonas veronii]
MNDLQLIDYLVFGCYFITVVSIGIWASNRKGGTKTTDGYFLAGKSLPWWIIGSSLIAANISTEQIIGMNGTAFESGIAVSSYSLLGAVVPILITAKFLLPTFLRLGVYSMPDFLTKRYDSRVSTGMGVFWVCLFIFVNLTSILSLGAITLQSVMGVPIVYGCIILATISAFYTIYGGLSAVAWTDFIQVVVLVFGGFAVLYFGLNAISDNQGVLQGVVTLFETQRDSFHLVLSSDHPELPWTGVFLGGIIIAALPYWGCNQYIIQRALAAKNENEARNGLLFAAFLSFVVGVIIVIPGVIAKATIAEYVTSRDQAFPLLVKEFIPVGFTGLIIAALIAAIVSSLNSLVTSASTIFTLDIWTKVSGHQGDDAKKVRVGRIFSAVALAIAILIAPKVASMGSLFAFIQEYSGFITPGVLIVFVLGIYWSHMTPTAALAVVLLTIPVSTIIKFSLVDTAFLNRMIVTTLILLFVAISFSLYGKKGNNNGALLVAKARDASCSEDVNINVADGDVLTIDASSKQELIFNIGATACMALVLAIYVIAS